MASDLPSGWKREERYSDVYIKKKTKKGTYAVPGKKNTRNANNVVYISPDNVEVTTLHYLQKLLPNHDLNFFDFKSGKSLRSDSRKLKLKHKEILKDGTYFPKRTISGGSILSRLGFPSTVTVIGNHEESDVKVTTASNPNNQPQKVTRRKPRQIFWNKRLANPSSTYTYSTQKSNNNNNASDNKNKYGVKMDVNMHKNPEYKLPDAINPLLDSVPRDVLTSFVGCLHQASQHDQQVVGQQPNHIKAIQNNPAVWINHSQPVFEKLIVTDDDIKKQEEKVLQLREKLLQLQE